MQRTRCAPLPLWGGVGVGGREIDALALPYALPPSPPSPARGEGADRFAARLIPSDRDALRRRRLSITLQFVTDETWLALRTDCLSLGQMTIHRATFLEKRAQKNQWLSDLACACGVLERASGARAPSDLSATRGPKLRLMQFKMSLNRCLIWPRWVIWSCDGGGEPYVAPSGQVSGRTGRVGAKGTFQGEQRPRKSNPPRHTWRLR